MTPGETSGFEDPRDLTVGAPGAARDAFDRLPMGVATLTEPDGVLETANAAFRTFAGRDDLVGLLSADILPIGVRDRILTLCAQARASGAEETMLGLQVAPGTSPYSGDSVDIRAIPLFADSRLTGLSLVVQQANGVHGGDDTMTDDSAQTWWEELYDVLLPRGVAVLPGLELAATCLLPAIGDARRGDWFDSFALGDGRAALVVGDVPGQGLSAAVTMSRVRSVLGAALKATGDPALALQRLDEWVQDCPEAHATTVVTAVVDAPAGELVYCTAGHPAPLLVPGAGRDAYYLSAATAGSLGSGAAYERQTHRLEAGDIVLLYSDGLIERPGTPRSRGTVEVAETALRVLDHDGLGPDHESRVERIVRRLPARLIEGNGAADDVVVLGVELKAESTRALRLELPPVAESLLDLRADLDLWLDEICLSMTDAMALHHATAELVANSVRHAYRDADVEARPVSVNADVTDSGRVVVEVVDQGRWREAETPEQQPLSGGRGLSLARLLTDQLQVEKRPVGTTVRLSFAPVRPVSLFTTTPKRRGGRSTAAFDLVEQADGLAVTGPMDLGQAETMRFALARATRGGTRGTVVHLTGASHLDSTAVQVLLDAQKACQVNGSRLDLVAAPGTPAQLVLETAGLSYRTDVGSD